ncbi:hypothetical protein [Corynebacterium striatum]|uniref:hypothetical protein n=1 Tax=Corynebacterium striatum TaxID=43770 RepID=UPI00254ADA84|nr:hypothetical protein [Corynebacterium striatum]MDK8808304.1 hypothetical protein [Corynebacterium striatum]MDK8833454.1 hypothetical protein [Corynebacterium striatum]
MGADSAVRGIVDEAHQAAASQALDYLSEHAGYTRKQVKEPTGKRLIVETHTTTKLREEFKTSAVPDAIKRNLRVW